MIARQVVAAFLAASIMALIAGSAGADEGLVAEHVALDGIDLVDATGLEIFKFSVHLRKGQTVRVTLDVRTDEAAQPTNYISREVTAQREGEATLLASFLRQDRKLASVFLSEEERLVFRIQWQGVANDGLSGNISNPLSDIPLGSKALSVHRQPQKLSDGSSELLLLFHTRHTPGKGLTKLYPQASLRIEPVK